MRILDLFSGIGGFSLASTWVWGDELEIAGFCEIDEYCRKVLRKNFPGVPIYEDIKKLNGEEFNNIDLITGGFPCTDISVAGKGKGLVDEETGERTRSGLWFEMHRIIGEVRPKFALIENVPMLTLRGGTRVIADLTQIGYDAEWQIIGASDLNPPAWHRRKRIWIVAYPNCDGAEWNKSKNRTRSRTLEGSKDVSNAKHDGLATTEVGRSVVPSSENVKEGSKQPGEFERIRESESERNIQGSEEISNSASIRPYPEKDEQVMEGEGRGELFASKPGSNGSYERALEPKMGQLAHGLSPELVGRWDREPEGVPRVATDVKNRREKLMALGNSIVPQCAYLILKKIKEAMK